VSRDREHPSSAPTQQDEGRERHRPISEEDPTRTGTTPVPATWAEPDEPALVTPPWAHLDPLTVPDEVPLPGAKKRHPVYVWLEEHGLALDRHGGRLDRLEFVVVVLVGVAVGAFSAGVAVSAVLAWTWLQVVSG